MTQKNKQQYSVASFTITNISDKDADKFHIHQFSEGCTFKPLI